MAMREVRVIQGAITVTLDKDGKKVTRYRFGQVVKLDDRFTDVDRLIQLKAVQDPSDDAPGRPINAKAAALAAQIAAGDDPSPVVNLGDVKNEDPEVADADPEGRDKGLDGPPVGDPGVQASPADPNNGGPQPGPGPNA